MDRKHLAQAGLTAPKTGPGVRRRVFQSAAIAFFIFSAPAWACASTLGSSIGAGRLLPAAAAMTALIGIITGRLALLRSRRAGNWQGGAILAGILGLIGVATGVLHAANSAGGFGTGNGLAGAIVAIALGLISITLGGLAFFRSRRSTPNSNTSPTASREDRI